LLTHILFFAEIGVTMKDNSMIKYDFSGSWRSTLSEHIRVGFTTTHPKGFLLGLFSNISGEYMTIMVSNSGMLPFCIRVRIYIRYMKIHAGTKLAPQTPRTFIRTSSGKEDCNFLFFYKPRAVILRATR